MARNMQGHAIREEHRTLRAEFEARMREVDARHAARHALVAAYEAEAAPLREAFAHELDAAWTRDEERRAQRRARDAERAASLAGAAS